MEIPLPERGKFFKKKRNFIALKISMLWMKISHWIIYLKQGLIFKGSVYSAYTWSVIKHQGVVQPSPKGVHANQPTKDIQPGWRPCNEQLVMLVKPAIIDKPMINPSLNAINMLKLLQHIVMTWANLPGTAQPTLACLVNQSSSSGLSLIPNIT